ncbi:MAG TPA: ribose-phosphate diphosphokinase [Dongiaceae bacterium]|nr:ribose-phosphate diphosphokinase [Dongiaceae bacterium]
MLFSFPEYAHMSEASCGLKCLQQGRFCITRRQNQELHATVQSPVSGEQCFILGTIAPPEHQMASMLLLAHTLRKEGAKRITGILPYLAYAREDHLIKPGESFTTAWVGAVLKASGFDAIWTVDVHSERDKEIFPVALESFSPAALFAECIKNLGLTGASVVAADEGAIPRCQAVKSAAGMTSGEIVYFDKRRTDNGIIHSGPIGKVGSRAVIVDDILDTGGTLVSACKGLARVGAEELYIFVTHGLFTGQLWRDLWSLPVKHIFRTDTIPACTSIHDSRITTLAVGPLLCEKLAFLDID